MNKLHVLVPCGLLLSAAMASATLVTYPAMPGFPTNNTFGVQARVPGGTWQSLSAYNVQVVYPSSINSSMVNFSFSDTVEMKVTLNQGTLSSSEIRPASFGITPTQSGNVLTFDIIQNDTFPRKFVIRVNNSWDQLCLHVIGNPLEVNPPAQSAVTYYFGPGAYSGSQTSALSHLSSGNKVYIAGGAWVQTGPISASNAQNIWIGGRGFIQVTGFASKIQTTNCSNITVDGITMINAGSGSGVNLIESDHGTVSNFNLFGCLEYNDGIHFDGSQNCTATGCFVRTTDDLMIINGARDGAENVSDDTYKNSVVWGDKAHIFLLGYDGNVNDNNIEQNVLYQNIDVINHVEAGEPWQGVMSIWCTGNQTIRNITYQDIRIMAVQTPGSCEIFHFNLDAGYSTNVKGKAIRNIVVRNVSYAGSGENKSEIYGVDASSTIDTVQFINYIRNGTLVTSASNGNMTIGNYAYHITFSGPQQTGTTRPSFVTMSENDKRMSYEIFDVSGRICGTVLRMDKGRSLLRSGATCALPAGIYFAKHNNGEGCFVNKGTK